MQKGQSSAKYPVEYLVPYAAGLLNWGTDGGFLVTAAYVAELLQLLSFVFNSHMPISSSNNRLWLAIVGGLQGNFLWDPTIAWSHSEIGSNNRERDHALGAAGAIPDQAPTAASLAFTNQFLVFFWMSAACVLLILAGVMVSVLRPRAQFLVKEIAALHLVLWGPLFYPVANIFLASFTCTKGTTGTLWLFPQEGVCMGTPLLAAHWVLGLAFYAIFCSLMLLSAFGAFVREKSGESVPSQAHTWVQQSFWLFKVSMPLCFHLLLGRNMHSYYTIIVALACLAMCGLYSFILPYHKNWYNEVTAAVFAVVGWCAIMSFAHINEGEVDQNVTQGGIYGQMIAGSLVCAALAYGACRARLSPTTQYLLRQSVKPEWVPKHRNPFVIAATASDTGLLPFPNGLPHSDTIFSPIRGIEQEILSEHHARMGSESAAICQSLLDSYLVTVQVVSPLISRVVASSDVEVACRFLDEWVTITGSDPTPHMLSFASRIFSKGILKFNTSPIVIQHYVNFVCFYVPSPGRLNACVSMLNDAASRFSCDMSDYIVFQDQITNLKSDLGVQDRSSRLNARAMTTHYRNSMAQIALLWRNVQSGANVTTLASQASLYNDVRRQALRAFMNSLQDENLDEIQVRRFGHFLMNVFENETACEACMRVAQAIRDERRGRLVDDQDEEEKDDDGEHKEGGSRASSSNASSRLSRSQMRILSVQRQLDLQQTIVQSFDAQMVGIMAGSSLYHWLLLMGFTLILLIIGANVGVTFVASDQDVRVNDQLLPLSNGRYLVPLLSTEVHRLVNLTQHIHQTKQEITNGVATAYETLASLESETTYVLDKIDALREELVSTINTVTVGRGKPDTVRGRLYLEERIFRIRLYHAPVNGIDHHDVGMNFLELASLFTSSIREIQHLAKGDVLLGSHYIETVTFNAPRVVSEAFRGAIDTVFLVNDDQTAVTSWIAIGILIFSLLILVLLFLGMFYQASNISAKRLQSIHLLHQVPRDVSKRLATESLTKLERFMENEETIGMSAATDLDTEKTAAKIDSEEQTDAPQNTQITSHRLLSSVLNKDQSIKADQGGIRKNAGLLGESISYKTPETNDEMERSKCLLESILEFNTQNGGTQNQQQAPTAGGGAAPQAVPVPKTSPTTQRRDDTFGPADSTSEKGLLDGSDAEKDSNADDDDEVKSGAQSKQNKTRAAEAEARSIWVTASLLALLGITAALVVILLLARTGDVLDQGGEIPIFQELVELEQTLSLEAKSFTTTNRLEYYTTAMETLLVIKRLDYSKLEVLHYSAMDHFLVAMNARAEFHHRLKIALYLVAHAAGFGPQDAPEAQDPVWDDSFVVVNEVRYEIHNSTWQLQQSSEDKIAAAQDILFNHAFDHFQAEFVHGVSLALLDRLDFAKAANDAIVASRTSYSIAIAVLACLSVLGFFTLVVRSQEYRRYSVLLLFGLHFCCLIAVTALTLITADNEEKVVADMALRARATQFLVEEMVLTVNLDSKVRGYALFGKTVFLEGYESFILNKGDHEHQAAFFTRDTPPSTPQISAVLARDKRIAEELHYLQRVGVALAEKAFNHQSVLPFLSQGWSLETELTFRVDRLVYPAVAEGRFQVLDNTTESYYNISSEDLAETNKTILAQKAVGAVGGRRYADRVRERLRSQQEVARVINAELLRAFHKEDAGMHNGQLALSAVALASVLLLYSLLSLYALLLARTEDQEIIMNQLFPTATTKGVGLGFAVVFVFLVGLTILNMNFVTTLAHEAQVLRPAAARTGNLAQSVSLLEGMIHGHNFEEKFTLQDILKGTVAKSEQANFDVLFGHEAFGSLRASQNIKFFGPQTDTQTIDLRTMSLGDTTMLATYEGPTGLQQTGVLQFLSLLREVDAVGNYHKGALVDEAFNIVPTRYTPRVALKQIGVNSLKKIDTVMHTLGGSTASYAAAILSSAMQKRVIGSCLAAVALAVVSLIFFVLLFPMVQRARQQESDSRTLFLALPEDVRAGGDIADFITGEDDSEEKQMAKNLQLSEKLLQNILPPSISRRLKGGETTIADQHDNVTVAFAALWGFDEYSASMAADELVLFLNALIVTYDAIVDLLELEKIKTIADTYFLCGGLSKQSENDHPLRTVDCAMFFMEALSDHNSRYSTPNLKMRIGIHTGPAVAGVIGTTKVAYDLWGDTVNTSSRMYSTSKPGKIQCSKSTHDAGVEDYFTWTNNEVVAKGKGTLNTYLLDQRKEETPWSGEGWRRKVNL